MVASGFAPLSYYELKKIIDSVRVSLRSAGFGSNARIAIALRNGPHAALAIVAVTCSAVGIPFDPRQTLGEFDSAFAELRPNAVLVLKGADSAARRVAERKGITIIEASPLQDGTLGFSIAASRAGSAVPPDDSDEPSALALILQTSGTSANPKLVPITHSVMVSSAEREQASYQLTPVDRCLSITPVWYAFGLLLPVFTPLLTGGSVAIPTSGLKIDLSEWLSGLRPTWFSAAPTVHLSILERLEKTKSLSTKHSLRFILTGGAPPTQKVREDLQSLLGVPLLDRYGASETQLISTNCPPPGASKPGTCGTPWPNTVKLVDDDGRQLSPGEPGEVLVRGSTVIAGYLNASAINRARFSDGWYKTGDIGSLDEDGFLTLRGRKDELINRGGEKISPVEIDDALMRHPAVAEAAAFAVPDSRLGEDIAAAVVLRPGATATPGELRKHLQNRLTPFKVPQRIVIRDQLPKGQIGKIARRLLAEELEKKAATGALITESEPIKADAGLVLQLAEIWGRVLKNPPVSFEDDFFENSGDSLLATEMLLELEQLTGRSIPSAILFEAPTFGQLAQRLSDPVYLGQKSKAIIRLNSHGTQTPLFMFHQSGYPEIVLARFLGDDQPILLVAPHGADGKPIPSSIEAMAADHLPEILEIQPEGPYRLCGNCAQGVVAFEVARLLIAAEKKVELVIMLDTPNVNANRSLQLFFSAMRRARPIANGFIDRATVWVWHQCVRLIQFMSLPLPRRRIVLKRKIKDFLAGNVKQPMDNWLVEQSTLFPKYSPTPLAVKIAFFSADYNAKDWRRLSSNLELIETPGTHLDLDPAFVAENLRPRLRPAATDSIPSSAIAEK